MILKFHEVADIFSMMEGAELQRLADDIKANRQREPIWLHPDGPILVCPEHGKGMTCQEP